MSGHIGSKAFSCCNAPNFTKKYSFSFLVTVARLTAEHKHKLSLKMAVVVRSFIWLHFVQWSSEMATLWAKRKRNGLKMSNATTKKQTSHNTFGVKCRAKRRGDSNKQNCVTKKLPLWELRAEFVEGLMLNAYY